MDIFEQRGDAAHSSAEWEQFQKVFTDIGCIKLKKGSGKAFLDRNAAEILGVEECRGSGEMAEGDFALLIQLLRTQPSEDYPDVYSLTKPTGISWVKLSMMDSEAEILCFVQDLTKKIEAEIAAKNADYDPLTHLLTSGAFTNRAEKIFAARKGESSCMAVLNLRGKEAELDYDCHDAFLAAAAAAILPFSSENVLIGLRNFKGFLAFFVGMDKTEVLETLIKMNDAVAECGAGEIGERLCLNAGYARCPEHARSINELLAHADFASYETRLSRGALREFSREKYDSEKQSFAEMQNFTHIVDQNLVNYHFQPIIDARTGEVYAYEALMRPVSETPLSPLQLIEIAERHDKLSEIEKLTFRNTLDYLSKHQQFFEKKKLFINSITSCILSDSEFSEIISRYGELFEKVVVEITEQADLPDETLNIIKTRYASSGSEIAIDDYGTGYSNTSNLLRCLPNYVKVDRALISGVDADEKKQHFVSNIIKFCKANDILVLAEGVETDSELKWVVREGADLIQGYFTSRPKPVLINEISRDVREVILKARRESSSADREKRFEITEPTNVDLMTLALAKYTEIYVSAKSATITGNDERATGISVIVADNIETHIEFVNANIHGGRRPAVILGENSIAYLKFTGKNDFAFGGIVVPDSSALTICGEGSLSVEVDHNDGIGIGADSAHCYGSITCDLGGLLSVSVNGEKSVCIGGGKNLFGSEIIIKRGSLQLLATGKEAVALGSMSGNGYVKADKRCSLKIRVSGDRAVGIGALDNELKVECGGQLDICTMGIESVGIGVLFNGSGYIDLTDSVGSILLKTRVGSGIGTINGNVRTEIGGSRLVIRSQGEAIAAIGDCRGDGQVRIVNTRLTVKQSAGADSIEVGSPLGKVEIIGGEVNARVFGQIMAQ